MYCPNRNLNRTIFHYLLPYSISRYIFCYTLFVLLVPDAWSMINPVFSFIFAIVSIFCFFFYLKILNTGSRLAHILGKNSTNGLIWIDRSLFYLLSLLSLVSFQWVWIWVFPLKWCHDGANVIKNLIDIVKLMGICWGSETKELMTLDIYWLYVCSGTNFNMWDSWHFSRKTYFPWKWTDIRK